MKYTIQDLKNGICAVHNNGTVEELRGILYIAFPSDKAHVSGDFNFYYAHVTTSKWLCADTTNLPVQSVKDFLKPDFILPEKWYIRVDKENLQMLGEWRSNGPVGEMRSDNPNPKGHISNYDGVKGMYHTQAPSDMTPITTEQFKKYVLNQKEEKEMDKRFPFKLTQDQGKRIINNVCNDWKNKLLDKWSKQFVLHGHANVTEEFYKEGRKAANGTSNSVTLHFILDEIFGKDELKYYEILSIENNYSDIYVLESDGMYHFHNYPGKSDQDLTVSINRINIPGSGFKIYSIKRLSDGEIFSIGDKVDGTSYKSVTITSIDLNPDCTVQVQFNHEDEGIDFKKAKKVKQKLFTTHDNVDIYEGDTYHSIWFESFSYVGNYVAEVINSRFSNENCKTFSTKEKALDYIAMNKPCLSLEPFKITLYLGMK